MPQLRIADNRSMSDKCAMLLVSLVGENDAPIERSNTDALIVRFMSFLSCQELWQKYTRKYLKVKFVLLLREQ